MKPETFQRYILVSPSLWYDHKIIFELESNYAKKHDSLKAKVFFGVGGYEDILPMVRDMKKLVKVMNSRLYKGLRMDSYVFEKETHNSVFPAALSRGLRVVFR